MVKIISNEEYAKLTRDVDCWKRRALEEKEHWQKIHENKVSDIIKENRLLRRKLEELEKKVTFVSFGEVKSLRKAREIAEEFRKALNNEHQCNRHCFKEHILPAIQSDLNNFRYEKDSEEFDFLCYWDKKIKKEYDFVKYLHIYNGLIGVTFYSI